jgi:quinol monooxygenase YgiN
MPITRLNEFTAATGKVDELHRMCESIARTVAASSGCVSCQLLRSQAEPARFVFIEVWENQEAHRAAVKQIPRESIAAVMPLLSSPPKGEYYEHVL